MTQTRAFMAFGGGWEYFKFSAGLWGGGCEWLEHNYRSVASVLNLANALIAQNSERLDKSLKAVKAKGEEVKIYRAKDARPGG
ncbi:MAG: 3'-5' exonuclease [Deinococcales bacterium]